MSENGQLTRREFIKRAAFTATATAIDPKTLFSYEREGLPIPPFPQVSGDLLPKFSLRSIFTRTRETTEIHALPERREKTRSWTELEPQNSPPASYRSAIAYDPGRKRYILHGGWIGETENNHSQTWVYKESDWHLLEEGSTPGLHGHKMVYTPEGAVIFGGNIESSGEWVPTNKFYLLREDQDGEHWEELTPDVMNDEEVPNLQGMGMVYDPQRQSIWIVGGATEGLSLCDNVRELRLPGTYEENWFFRGVGWLDGYDRLPRIFEPLAFIGLDNNLFIYGGQGYSDYFNTAYRITPVSNNIRIDQEDWIRSDFGGAVRGDFDPSANRLVLNAGRGTSILFGKYYPESVEYDPDANLWVTIDSPNNPLGASKPSVAMNPDTGAMLRFGGIVWDTTINDWTYSNKTWICNPIKKVYLPSIH